SHTPLTIYVFFFTLHPPPRSTLFPYTTLFRSLRPLPHPDRRPGGPEPEREGDPLCRSRHRFDAARARRDAAAADTAAGLQRGARSEEHTSELQSRFDLVCRLLLEKKKIENMRT